MTPVVFYVICWTRYRTDGRTKRRLYASPFGEHKKVACITNKESRLEEILCVPTCAFEDITSVSSLPTGVVKTKQCCIYSHIGALNV